ncbi:hypothetical protein GCM10011378_26090 [Hymenobacter glacieicola]|uniref:Uncharacterized protein n=1 Tax=Hymenobacter glacieicola TaxID=1562124 RepID=A0ABQ1WXZ7_9BACT|nr:hypothetical protein GCM10011378_26090 [Hymenobacter glacieicola]
MRRGSAAGSITWGGEASVCCNGAVLVSGVCGPAAEADWGARAQSERKSERPRRLADRMEGIGGAGKWKTAGIRLALRR